ncbi:MAG: TIGR03619 family F420-dependent LLM class oxidoreductase [Proteobacteria bacterium]|nr:TIGR03619 family F420-dependent LLM class oxidoreductase [Pseudomonadota bacterium]
MRFSFGDSMCDPSHYLPLARAVEDLGYDSFPVPDSICYPDVAVGEYPYKADGGREFLDGAPFIDPFQLIAALGTVTERLRFKTSVLKLPIRNPVLVAKMTSSLAYLTGNRFVLGVGLSPWIEDFQVTNQDWKTRGRRMDQMIEIVRGLMSGEYYEFHSEFYDIPRIKLCPVPGEPVPIMIGGHSPAAYRRAARLADGFMFAGVNKAELAATVAEIDAYRREYGREDEPFEIHAGVVELQGAADLAWLEDVGVTELGLGPRNAYEPDSLNVQQKIEIASRLADELGVGAR